MNKLLNAIFVPLVMLFAAEPLTAAQDDAYDVFVPIAKYMGQGNADKLSAWFADNLEITVISTSNDSSRNQARQILKSLSTQPAGMERGALLDKLMTGRESEGVERVDLLLSKVLDMLENDGYIMKNGALRTFRSPLLRDYWFDRFVL